MNLRSIAILCATAAALAAPGVAHAAAPTRTSANGGNFILTLGKDTTSFEKFTRTPSRLEVDQVGRSPRVMRRHFVYDYTQGDLSHFSMVVRAAGDTAVTQAIDAALGPDSIVTDIRTAGKPANRASVAAPKGTLVVPLTSRWPGYETLTMRLAQTKADSIHGNELYLGGTDVVPFGIVRIGTDSVEFHNQVGDVFHARIDAQGRVLGVLPVHSTGKFAVTRVASLDLDAMAAHYLAVDKAGGGMGVLSPRDTVKATDASGVWMWIDYGRPMVRGRTIFGQVVPYGEVWRTGANAATQMKIERPLVFEDKVVPAGFYTLWTVPSPDGWKLIINGETGQWGTEHKAEKDLYTIPMATTALPDLVEQFRISIMTSDSGDTVLAMDWDHTRATVHFHERR